MKAIQIYEQFLDTQSLANRTAIKLVELHGSEFCNKNVDTLIERIEKSSEMTELFVKCVREKITALTLI